MTVGAIGWLCVVVPLVGVLITRSWGFTIAFYSGIVVSFLVQSSLPLLKQGLYHFIMHTPWSTAFDNGLIIDLVGVGIIDIPWVIAALLLPSALGLGSLVDLSFL